MRAKRRVVWHAQRQTEQADDGTDQNLGLPIGEAKHRAQRQGGQDRQWRVPGLAATRRARLGHPGGDRLLGNPHRQTPALAQAGVVGRPVGDFMPLPRDMMAAVLVQLEGQGCIRVR